MSIKFPDLFIDTQALHLDFQLRGKNFDKIKKYKQYTNSNIYICECVISELIEQYKRDVLDSTGSGILSLIATINDKINDLNKFQYINNTEFEKIEYNYDINEMIENYGRYLHRKLEENNIEIVGNPKGDNILQKIILKSVKSIKPFDTKTDKGLKDSIIRESYLEILSKNKDNEIIFLSNNCSDFGYKDKEGFHDDLIKELGPLKGLYYKKIDHVREKYLSDIEPHLDLCMIEEKLDISYLIDYLKTLLRSESTNIIDNSKMNYGIIINEILFNEDIEITDFKSVYITSKSDLQTKLKLTIVLQVKYEIIAQGNRKGSEETYLDKFIERDLEIDLELNNTTGNIKWIYNDRENLINNDLEDVDKDILENIELDTEEILYELKGFLGKNNMPIIEIEDIYLELQDEILTQKRKYDQKKEEEEYYNDIFTG